jgi:Family of unknown function (DUF5565)
MKKIPTLFQRTARGPLVVDQLTPGCEWVAAGEGWATRKLDGTCCLIRGDKLFKRRAFKSSENPPEDFEMVDFDAYTGTTYGWVPVGDGPEDQYHREAFDPLAVRGFDGTYELVGPKVQGNPEGFYAHILVAHELLSLLGDAGPSSEIPPRDFAGIRAYLDGRDIEGIVFHHPDGRMVKIKGRDFGLVRPVREPALR